MIQYAFTIYPLYSIILLLFCKEYHWFPLKFYTEVSETILVNANVHFIGMYRTPADIKQPVLYKRLRKQDMFEGIVVVIITAKTLICVLIFE